MYKGIVTILKCSNKEISGLEDSKWQTQIL